MQFKTETITPKKAEQYLSKNLVNRPLRRSRVEQISRDLVAGEWVNTGESIKFASNGGALIDGQHRLTAVKETGVSIETVVVRGLDSDALYHLDQGLSRKPADYLHIQGFDNSDTVARAADIVLRFEQTGGSPANRRGSAPTRHEILDCITRHPGLFDSAKQTKYNYLMRLNKAHVCALHYLFSRHNRELADQFWSHVLDGVGDTKGSPTWVLRQRLLADARDKRRLPMIEKLSMIIKAWNAFARGVKVASWQTLAFKRHGKNVEKPPKIFGYKA